MQETVTQQLAPRMAGGVLWSNKIKSRTFGSRYRAMISSNSLRQSHVWLYCCHSYSGDIKIHSQWEGVWAGKWQLYFQLPSTALAQFAIVTKLII